MEALALGDCPKGFIYYAALEETAIPEDASENDSQGDDCSEDVQVMNSHYSLICAEHGFMTTLRADDLVVVETKDAVLIARSNRLPYVKRVVEAIWSSGRHEL
ncbi:hypothetical protein [Mangrovitalea sediminis]|uniref:hypothetical protein n=1 Tax=Mangrovitalea sediminis TaxID=1982043 RepID=UPI000BE623A7|nr:hypothetical protein [Mangrovitalea sediminis]